MKNSCCCLLLVALLSGLLNASQADDGLEAPPADLDLAANPTAGQELSQVPWAGTFCWCPPGEFLMGQEKVCVEITTGFWIGKHEVTQAQYEHLMGSHDCEFEGPFLPVHFVSWDNATEFCEKLTKLESQAGRLPKGWEYRLPTEAQWEYASRAGTKTSYFFGEFTSADFVDNEQNIQLLGKHAWHQMNSDAKLHPVGLKQANPWGIHDMYGNVFEWCRDYDKKDLPGGQDPFNSTPSPYRVTRGCAISVVPHIGFNFHRLPTKPDIHYYNDLGFRLVLAHRE